MKELSLNQMEMVSGDLVVVLLWDYRISRFGYSGVGSFGGVNLGKS
jgi:hypothetical protein